MNGTDGDGRRADGAGGRTGGRHARRPPRTTAKALENAAVHYLARFASSTGRLRAVLLRRVRKAHADDPDAATDAAARIETVIAKLVGLGLIDDVSYAASRARALHGRGQPRRLIVRRLAEAGIAGEDAERALAGLSEGEAADLDLRAAVALARRRRLGPFRKRPADEGQRERDLATLARAGFSYDIARRVIAAGDAEAAEALAAGTPE